MRMRFLGRKNKYLKTQGKESFDKSFGHAIDGIEYAINHERNIKMEVLAGIIASILGFVLHISILEWVVIVLVIGAVLALELVNTAIERSVDLVTKDYHDLAKAAKDVAAGAVLIMSFCSVIIGALIFLPKIIDLLGVR